MLSLDQAVSRKEQGLCLGAGGEKQVMNEVRRKAAAETHLWGGFPVSLALQVETNWCLVHCFVLLKSKVHEHQ